MAYLLGFALPSPQSTTILRYPQFDNFGDNYFSPNRAQHLNKHHETCILGDNYEKFDCMVNIPYVFRVTIRRKYLPKKLDFCGT